MNRRALPLLAALVFVTTAPAQVTFAFNYSDSPGTGFNDTTFGSARQSALQWAGTTLSNYFTGYSSRTVTFNVTSYSTNDGTLASAGSSISGITVDGFYKTNAQKMIQDNSGPGDGSISWNFFHDWDYDDDVSVSSFDFKAVALHEVLHALGFSSLISSTEQGGFSAPSGDTDVWSTFDQFVTDSAGTRLVTEGADFNTSLSGIVSNTGGASGDVFFNGTNARAAYGNNPVPLYSPATFESGSSLSHLNTDVFGTNSYVMTHAVTSGPAIRTLSAIELGILMDLGYSVTAIPEPGTYALLFGTVALGFAAFRRRRAA